MSNRPAFPLARVHQLAKAMQFRACGRKAIQDMERHFGGKDGLAKVFCQLSPKEFYKTVREKLPPAYAAADVYKICLDENLDKVPPNIHDMTQCEFYLKIVIEDDKVLVSLSNHD